MKSILHIEDEAYFRESMAFLLEEEGFRAISTSSGEKALEIMRKNAPDLVLCDISMPGMSGFELFEHTKMLFDTTGKHTPFIFLSGLDDNENIIKGTNLKPDDYITKTVSFSVLVAKINNTISRYESWKNKNNCSSTRKIQECAIALNNYIKYFRRENNSFYLSKITESSNKLISYCSNKSQSFDIYNTPINDLTLNKEPISIRKILEKATASLKRNKSLMMHPIFLDISSDLPLLEADTNYFCHSIELILKNLIKHSEDDGSTTIRAIKTKRDFIEVSFYFSEYDREKIKISYNEICNIKFINNVLALHITKLNKHDDCIKLNIATKPFKN